MNEQPSSSSGSNEGKNNTPHRAILLLQENAEQQRRQQVRERRAGRERAMQARIRQREREYRLQNLQRDLPMPPRQYIAMEDPYDSAESGYWSIKDRRPKSKTEQMWDRMRIRERRLREEKERQKRKEDKQELDAMFHVMLHGSGDELGLSDGSEYEYKLPEFLKFDEIKKGFQEQLKRERSIKKEKEEAENKASGAPQPQEYREEVKPTPSFSYSNNLWGYQFCGYSYKFPSSNTDWGLENILNMNKKQKPQTNNTVIEVYGSSDEEDNGTTAIAKRAMKWSNGSAKKSRSCPATATTTSSAIITVHDSDSE